MGFFDSLRRRAGKGFSDAIKAAAEAARLQLKSSGGAFQTDLKKNKTISERTRLELNQQMGVDSAINKGILGTGSIGAGFNSLKSLQDIFGKAKEGTETKYKTRQVTQQLFNTMVDKPDSQRLRGGILNFGSSVRK